MVEAEQLDRLYAAVARLPKPFFDDGGGRLVYRGDARELLPLIEPGSVGAFFSDPPYSSGGAMRSDRNSTTAAKYQRSGIRALPDFTGDNRDQRSWCSWVADWLSTARVLSELGGLCFLFTDWRQLPSATDAVQWAGWVWRGLVTWHKPSGRRLQNRFASDSEYVVWGSVGPMPFDLESSAGPSSVITCDAPRGDGREHIAQKPVEVCRHLLALSSGIVLDPFAGSGTTGRACKDLGRCCVQIELEERYCQIAARRLAQEVLF